MKKLITASITFVVQDRTDADDENRQHRDPGKPFELMDSDNFRDSFADSIDEASLRVREIIENELGLSGGIELRSVDIETG